MKSFLEGRPIVSRNGSAVTRTDSQLPSLNRPGVEPSMPLLAGAAPVDRREHAQKKIETVEVDGVVQKIVVTCGCGERIEVHCGY